LTIVSHFLDIRYRCNKFNIFIHYPAPHGRHSLRFWHIQHRTFCNHLATHWRHTTTTSDHYIFAQNIRRTQEHCPCSNYIFGC